MMVKYKALKESTLLPNQSQFTPFLKVIICIADWGCHHQDI